MKRRNGGSGKRQIISSLLISEWKCGGWFCTRIFRRHGLGAVDMASGLGEGGVMAVDL